LWRSAEQFCLGTNILVHFASKIRLEKHNVKNSLGAWPYEEAPEELVLAPSGNRK
jgi:hypothetical protein